jgi:hypothetical protein
MPTMTILFTFEPHEGGTRMVTVTTFPSLEALEQLLGMGMEEGMKAAIGQIDAVLATPCARRHFVVPWRSMPRPGVGESCIR